MDERIKIMIAGDSLNQTTGLAYVAASFMRLFASTGKYKLSHITIAGKETTREGMRCQGKDFAETFADLPIYNCHVNKKDALKDIDEAISKELPDIVLTFHDPWVVDLLAYSPLRESYLLVNYMTVEIPEYPECVNQPSPIIPGQRKSIKDSLQRADLVIPVTQMGKEALLKLEAPVCEEHIYNGIEWNNRVKEKSSKRAVFGDMVEDDDFIFMTMGLNTERKRLDRVVEAFYKFQQKMGRNPKYKLYVHTDINMSSGGTDLREMIDRLELADRVLVPHGMQPLVGVEKNELYRRYSASDCYIGLPSGEGFGYGFAEAMMHGLPLIYTNYGGHTDYCKTAGLPVSVSDFVYAKNAYMRWALADTDDAAKAMARMVSDARFRERCAATGLSIAENQLAWPIVFHKLEAQLSGLASKRGSYSYAGIPLKRLI